MHHSDGKIWVVSWCRDPGHPLKLHHADPLMVTHCTMVGPHNPQEDNVTHHTRHSNGATKPRMEEILFRTMNSFLLHELFSASWFFSLFCFMNSFLPQFFSLASWILYLLLEFIFHFMNSSFLFPWILLFFSLLDSFFFALWILFFTPWILPALQ